jgi:hypothetical protein
MTRTFVAALVLALLSLPAAATTRVDLGDDKALDAIQAQNPAQYEKLIGIMKAAGEVSCETLPEMLKVQYGATDIRCLGALVRTSYPAKRWLAFTLDDVAFSGNVVLTGPPPTLRNADETQSNHVKPLGR